MSYLNIQGKGLKFNQLAYITFYEKVDQNNYVGTFHYAAAWAAYKANAYVKGEEITDTFEQVCEWVDTLSVEDKAKITEVFSTTACFKKLVEDGEKEEVKEEAPEKKRRSKSTTMSV